MGEKLNLGLTNFILNNQTFENFYLQKMDKTEGPRKLIIDTDPGVDDAMAIFMALEAHRRGQVEIVAFTLVSGNTKVENQPLNMLRILSLVPELYGKV